MAIRFHDGELAVQRRAGDGERAERLARSFGTVMPPIAQAFLAAQVMVLVAGRDPDGLVWCSALTGPPGFAHAADERTVVLEAAPHAQDPLFAHGAPAQVGLLAVEPASGRRMRVNGHAQQRGGALVVHAEQVFSNCRRNVRARVADRDDAAAPGPVRTATALDADQQALIHGADTFFVASTDPSGAADASHKGGRRGFVSIPDDRHLSWPDVTGNSLHMTLGNLTLQPRVGLLFLDWERGDLLALSGSAVVDWSPGRIDGVPGALRMVDLTLERVVHAPAASPLRWRDA